MDCGTFLGAVIAVILWWSNFLSKVSEPFLVVLNSLPKVALRTSNNNMGRCRNASNNSYGTSNFTNSNDSGNIKWFFNDSKTFLMECKNENYYDLIINNIVNTNIKEDISPPKKFFDNNVLLKIYSLLKSNGMYINNTMTRNLQAYAEAFNILDKVFPLIYVIDNNEDLNKIHFCFKNNSLSEDYEKVYKDNLSKLNNKEYCDNTLIDNIHRRIMPKVADTELVKKV